MSQAVSNALCSPPNPRGKELGEETQRSWSPDQLTSCQVQGRVHWGLRLPPYPCEGSGGGPVAQVRKSHGDEGLERASSTGCSDSGVWPPVQWTPIAEIMAVQVPHGLMQETITCENVAILFLEILGLSLSLVTKIIS